MRASRARASRALAVAAACALGASLAGCPGGGARPSAEAPREDATARPCADFELDVERFWSRSTRADVRAGILTAGGAVDEALVGRVVTKLDELSRDWVMMQEAVCKDAVVRKVTSADVYTKVSMCLRTTLISQRTLVASLRTPSREAIYKSDEALAVLRQDAVSCQKEAVYNAYSAHKAPEAPSPTVTAGRELAAGREALGEARAYAALADKKRLAEALARGLAAARSEKDPRLTVDLLVEEAERLNRFEVRPAEAKVAADEAIEIATRAGYDGALAAAYQQRGQADATVGKFAEALEWYERSRTIRERVFGTDHPETARVYNAIGAIHQDKFDHERALTWFMRAHAIREASLGKDHALTAASCNNVGNAHLGRRDFDEAIRWYERARDVKERVYGKEHPSTAVGYVNLGGAYQSKGNSDQALVLYKQALAIQERVLGPDHPDVGATMNNIAYACDTRGSLEEALTWYRRAEVIFLAKLGPNHPRMRQVKEGITTTCAKLPGKCPPP